METFVGLLPNGKSDTGQFENYHHFHYHVFRFAVGMRRSTAVSQVNIHDDVSTRALAALEICHVSAKIKAPCQHLILDRRKRVSRRRR